MAAVSAPATVARVFIACPGDLADQRGVVSQALATLNHDPAFAGRVELVPYAYENLVPARVGMDPEEVVTSYMLRPEDADLLICMFWRRMGTPLERVRNPATNAPYQSGTEYEFLSAYAAAQRQPTPLLLLYRRDPGVAVPATAEERLQLNRVNQFFARFTPSGDLLGLVGAFTDDDAQLAATIQRDVTALLPDLLTALANRTPTRPADETAQPVVFGLPNLPAGFVPRPESLAALRKALLGSRPQVGVVAAAALHGLGGLGKTVLARAAWEDPAIRAAFPAGVLWATVGQKPDLPRIQREWIRVLGGDYTQVTSLEAGRAELTRLIGDRPLLLVLDDIWQAADARALAVAGPRCRVLITTRFATQVTDGATPVPLDLMSPAECRQTLQSASRGQSLAKPLDDATLDTIAERVGRLPLALKVIAGLLALDLTWPEIRRELDAGRFEDVAVGDQSIFATLDASVRFLPPDQQERYRELVVFPEDEPLNPAAVTRLWARTANVSPFLAKRLLGEFRDRSLIQADHTLHDLQVDYLRATVLPDRVRALHSALCDAYSDPAPADDASPWSTLPDDDLYAWRFLATHLLHADRTSELEALLTDVTYLQAKIARLGVTATVADLTLLPNAEPLRLLASTLRAGAPTLAQHSDELMNQVRGRVGPIPTLHHVPNWPRPYFELYTQSLQPADPALVRILVGHTSTVNACAFSPDGALALSASEDRTLRLWEVASGRELRRFRGHTSDVRGCAFSPDGALVLSAPGDINGDRKLRLWEVASGRKLRRLVGHTDFVYDCAFSPDGTLVLSASEDRTLRLWEVASGRELRRFEGHTARVNDCAFSPDGVLALSASWDKTLRLWEVASGRELRRFEGHTREVNACAFSPDGALALSASEDRTLRLWEVASGRELRRFEGHADVVNSCAFSPDGTLAVSASNDQTLRLWEVASGRELRRFEGHTGRVLGCTFSPDGALILSTSEDKTLRLWEATSSRDVRRLIGHATWVRACAFSPDGTLVLSASEDRTLRLWEVASGRELRRFEGHTARVNDCAFSPDGVLALSASWDKTLRLWEVASGRELRRFEGHTREVNACAFSPDGALALSASEDRTLRLWEVASGRELRRFEGHTDGVYHRAFDIVHSCAFSPDGALALSASYDQTLRLWEVASGRELRRFKGHTDGVNSCAFSPDGALALSASYDQTLRLWEVASGRELRRFKGHTDGVNSCAFSPDGALALSASYDQTLRLWEVATGALRATWYGEAGNPCCAFGPQGDRVLAGDGAGGVHLFRLIGVAPVASPVVPSVAPVAHHAPASPIAPGTDAQSHATSAPPPKPAPKPRRKRFWLF